MPSERLETPQSDPPRAFSNAESEVPHLSSTIAPSSHVRALPSVLWETLVERLPHALLLVGPDERVLVANRAALEALGPEVGPIAGRYVHECLSARHVSEARAVLATTGAPYQYEEARFVHGAHQVLEVRAELVPELGPLLLLLTLRDVTNERRVNAEWLQSRPPGAGASSDEQLRQAQKMEALGQLTGGIVHDFNNLLAIILGNLEIAQRRLVQGRPLAAEIDRALHAAERGATLAQRLLAYSRRQRFEPWPTEVNELVVGILDLVRRTLGETIEVSAELGADLPEVLVDPIQLETALLNLALNSRDAMPSGGRLFVRTRKRSLDEAEAETRGVSAGTYVILGVEDTGCGIPENALSSVFEPFYTTKESGKGSGLGLSMVYGFARQAQGAIVVRSTVGEGTTVELYLPERSAPREPGQTKTPSVRPAGPRGTVLVAEASFELRQLVMDLARSVGLESVGAASAVEALEVLEADANITAVLCGAFPAGAPTGIELAQRVRKSRPELSVMFMTGYSDDVLARLESEEGIVVLRKPFGRAELGRALSAVQVLPP